MMSAEKEIEDYPMEGSSKGKEQATDKPGTSSGGNNNNSITANKNKDKPTKDTDKSAIDPWYEYDEPEPQKAKSEMYYTPSYFLRTHSKNNNPADVQTQIWQCCFPPPGALGAIINRNIVATCGGSSVCFIDVTSGEVLLKYNRSSKALASENLYALAWTTLEVTVDEGSDTESDGETAPVVKSVPTGERSSVVAAGGGKSTVVLVDVEAGFCYHMFRTVTSKANAIICSLLFHPKKHSWLFCGHEDGHIEIWDCGRLYRPNYQQTDCAPLMTLPAVAGDAYNLSYCHKQDLLIAGCDAALLVYNVDVEKITRQDKLDVTKVDLPVPAALGQDTNSVVDSIVMVRDNILAAKCALHARIYVMSIDMLLKKRKPAVQKNYDYYLAVGNDDVVSLEWSNTDNYYMNMGADARSCTLVCGDDKGTLWMYDLFELITGAVPSPLTENAAALKALIPPVAKMMWPDLDDPEVEKAGKLRLDSYDIVVDKCCIADGASHVVAVTSNNMVCIWQRGRPDDP